MVGEAVETPSQREVLESLGRDRAQGYPFGPPAQPELLDDLLRRGSRERSDS